MQLKQLKNHLETEKLDFLKILYLFMEKVFLEEFEIKDTGGRPRADLKEVIKCLVIMNYHSWSYRRSNSDFEILKERGELKKIPKRSTLNKYMNDLSLKKILENLIEFSSTIFIDIEDCIMVDSTHFFDRILIPANKRKGKSPIRMPTLDKTRKLHLTIAKNSRIIICARTSIGTTHDYNFARELIETPLKLGFKISKVLGDSAYNSREMFCLCEEKGIQAFLNFKKNSKTHRSQSKLRREQLLMFFDDKKTWHESYRFRVIIEQSIGVIKRKGRDHLRSRNDLAKDNEMLLKCFWYNLCIIARNMDSL